MNSKWNAVHSEIFMDLVEKLNKEKIKFFILRNYEELPENNTAKDVDIIVDPEEISKANKIIIDIYKQHDFSHSFFVRFASLYCWHGMDIDRHLSIHIDLLAGYQMKGYEVFTFNELYAHTIDYKGFKVLDHLYEGLMVFICKQFGYNPILKQEYKNIIYNSFNNYPELSQLLNQIIGLELTEKIVSAIAHKDFDRMLSYSDELSSKLRSYSFLKDPIGVINRSITFYWLKFVRIVLNRRKYIKSFSVMAPDGAGKTTFLDSLLNEISFYFITDVNSKCSIYHFRPQLLPNLGTVGEKAKVMKADKNFTTPHRAKPAGLLSSLLRISYYWIDYVLGWFAITPRDIQFDRFTVFDRYSYDLIVDPTRTRLGLPKWIRKAFVACMPHPKFSFYLDVEPDEIYRRKQELPLYEIKRQVSEYRGLAQTTKRIILLNGNRPVEQIRDEAVKILLNKFCNKLK
jgi:hypothetical protein